MRKGVIVKYVDRRGVTVKAVALDDEQHSKFRDYGKVFLRVLDDDCNFRGRKRFDITAIERQKPYP